MICVGDGRSMAAAGQIVVATDSASKSALSVLASESALVRRPIHLWQSASVHEPAENAVPVVEDLAAAGQPGVFLYCPPTILASRRVLRIHGVVHAIESTALQRRSCIVATTSVRFASPTSSPASVRVPVSRSASTIWRVLVRISAADRLIRWSATESSGVPDAPLGTGCSARSAGAAERGSAPKHVQSSCRVLRSLVGRVGGFKGPDQRILVAQAERLAVGCDIFLSHST